VHSLGSGVCRQADTHSSISRAAHPRYRDLASLLSASSKRCCGHNSAPQQLHEEEETLPAMQLAGALRSVAFGGVFDPTAQRSRIRCAWHTPLLLLASGVSGGQHHQ
jgi:hypothetical protein